MVKTLVRKASEDDVPQIVALERASTSAHWALTDYERLRTELDSGRRVVLVAESTDSAGKLLGFLIGQSVQSDWEIQNIVVAEPAKRMGVGSRLLEGLIAKARDGSAGNILLEVRESNSAARALYAKFGFQEAGKRKDYYSNPQENALVLKFAVL